MEEQPEAVKEQVLDKAKGDDSSTAANKERQERFKALQARAVGHQLTYSSTLCTDCVQYNSRVADLSYRKHPRRRT